MRKSQSRKTAEDTDLETLIKIRRRSGSQVTTACRPGAGNPDCLPKGPIYDSIYHDLVDGGYKECAKYFRFLVSKENDLVAQDVKFKKRFRDAQCLLRAVIDNVKAAEKSHREVGNRELTMRQLVQTVRMIQVQDEAYHWLVKELYRIVLDICETWEEECAEMIARTRYDYGLVLAERGDNLLNEAIIQLSKSLEACKSTMWYTNDRDRNILHEDVCVNLCETLLRQAKLDSRLHPREAAELAFRAVLTIVEVGISANKNLYCIAKLRQSEYLIADGDYNGAFKILNNLQNHIMSHDSPRNKCEFYLWLGICHFHVSASNLSTALRKFKLSLSLSESYNFADFKAKALLFLGKIHALNPNSQSQARECFIEAKALFHRLGDIENEKLSTYMMAKLRTYQIFPSYIELMKNASYAGFCYLFDLMQWKQKMLPFWNEKKELRDHVNEVQCLLTEQVGRELQIRPD